MPLTAEDVKNKQFTPTRFKGGYDEKEVDDFLDEVEAELSRLDAREHRPARPPSGRRAVGPAAGRGARACAAGVPRLRRPRRQPPPPAAGAPPPPPPPHRRAGRLRRPPPRRWSGTLRRRRLLAGSEGSQEAALRMLAMAQRTADDTVSDARREADKVLGEARQKADQLERETQERHRSVVGNLDSERERLERKIEELRSFEREYRARLKSYLEGQLRDLEGRTEGVQPTAPRPACGRRRPVGLGWQRRPQRRCRRRSVRRAQRPAYRVRRR